MLLQGKKHIITLVLLLIVGMGTVVAQVQIGDLYYNLDAESLTAEVAAMPNGKYAGDITIPSSVDYNATSYSVNRIGGYAFENCTDLTSVSIPSSITDIRGFAFAGCTSLTSITIPDGVLRIDDRVFLNCTALANVTIANSVEMIDILSFTGCTSLPVIDNIRYADTYLVEAVDKSLSSYTIKEGTKWIGSLAFDGCYNMTSITIPNSVIEVGYYCFQATGLISITIPANVISMDYRAFINCDHMTSISVDADNPNFSSIDGVLFNKDKTRLLRYPCGRHGAYTIPNGVTSIGDGAFSYSNYLTGVTIPNSVTLIDEYAFMSCIALSDITIPSSVELINRGFLHGCHSATALDVETDNLNYCSLDGVLFSKDQMLLIRCPEGRQGDYAIPDMVNHIGTDAFWSCALHSIIVPENVTSIEEHAFNYCANMTSITFESETPPSLLGNNTFDEDNKHPIYVPCDTQDVYKSAWSEYAERIHPTGYVVTAQSEDASQGLVEVTVLNQTN